MEHDPDKQKEQKVDESAPVFAGIAGVIMKVILGIITVFFVVVALFFGVCFLAG